jgi:hydrogenase nickel incorporation protein HypA/HybF
MHELSLAAAIVQLATRHADGRRVTKVEVEAGWLRQVVPSALELAFELVAEDTPVAGAELELTIVPASGRCRDCGSETELPGFPLACEACGGLEVEVLRGEELLVTALEIEDEPALTATGG